MRCVVGVVLAVDEDFESVMRDYRGNNPTTELNREILYYKRRELLCACNDSGCCARAVIVGARFALGAGFDSREWHSVSWCQQDVCWYGSIGVHLRSISRLPSHWHIGPFGGLPLWA